jgi:gamma-glutamyltranspeptidase/glutathione hydrolase
LIESDETTHISLMDSDGNSIATTQTINGRLGSGLVADGTGILMNNTMDDFAVKPGVANLFGAIGGKANAVKPRKTPLSSMSPTLVFQKNDLTKPIMSVGSPGGTRIITCVAQTMVNHLYFGRPLFESISDMRIHHQWTPDHISLETPGPSESLKKQLDSSKVTYKVESVPCRVMAISRQGDSMIGVTDPRDSGIVDGL